MCYVGLFLDGGGESTYGSSVEQELYWVVAWEKRRFQEWDAWFWHKRKISGIQPIMQGPEVRSHAAIEATSK